MSALMSELMDFSLLLLCLTFNPSDQLFFLLRQHETVAPLEDSTVTEVTSTLQEWALLWKKLYMVSSIQSVLSDPSTRTKQLLVCVCVCVECVCVDMSTSRQQ